MRMTWFANGSLEGSGRQETQRPGLTEYVGRTSGTITSRLGPLRECRANFYGKFRRGHQNLDVGSLSDVDFGCVL